MTAILVVWGGAQNIHGDGYDLSVDYVCLLCSSFLRGTVCLKLNCLKYDQFERFSRQMRALSSRNAEMLQ